MVVSEFQIVQISVNSGFLISPLSRIDSIKFLVEVLQGFPDLRHVTAFRLYGIIPVVVFGVHSVSSTCDFLG